MAEAGERRWDLFVSYTQADRAWAEWIAWVLEEDGHRVLVQAWDFVPGTNWIQGMRTAVGAAERTIAVLSTDYLSSVYGGAEWQAAWAADPDGRGRKLLTVRVNDCDRPGLLAGVVGIDVFDIPETKAKSRLRAMVSRAISGPAKPGTAPPFPTLGRAMPRAARFPEALPRIWNVPARNPVFIGRQEEVAAIARSLAAGETVMVRGMGGVGKSQLVNEYAYAHANEYDLVWWINADEPTLIPDQFAQLAYQLGLRLDAESNELRRMVHEALRDVHGWLLVFDNVDQAEAIRPWLPTVRLPREVPGHVVVTTRRGGFSGLGTVLDLDAMDSDDAVRMIRTRVPHTEESSALAIAEELGRLPLALEQAAAYLDRTGMPAEDYLVLLRNRAADLFATGAVHQRVEVMASLRDVSLERIGAQNPAAVLLLDLCAYLAPEPIPLDLFTAHPDRLPEPLEAAARDPLAFIDAISLIVDYSLARRTPAGLLFHRLVQTSVRARHHEPDLALRSTLALLRADVPAEVHNPGGWSRWEALLPHVLAATDFSDALPPGDPAAREARWLLDRAGAYLQSRGHYGHARPLLERALAGEEAGQGLDHPAVARRLNALASLLFDEGNPAHARPLLERAVAINEAAYGPDHPVVASDMTNLAALLLELGRADQARPLLERAVAINEAAYGPDHPETARSLRNLASIARQMGDPALCRRLLTRALMIDEAAYGPDHPVVVASLGELAAVVHDLGEAEAALPLAERALAIAERAYGPAHPEAGRAMNSLALMLQDLGRLDVAESLLRRSLDIAEDVYGMDHPAVATALNNLALVLRQRGDVLAARPLLERALAISEAAEGEDHQIVLLRLRSLMGVLRDLGDVERAGLLRDRAASLTSGAAG